MAKHNLIHLMNHSDLTVCNGYEIDNFWEDYHRANETRLMCGDDDIVFLPNDQEIEINEKLEVLPIEYDGDLYFFEFKILTPLNPDHLPLSFKS